MRIDLYWIDIAHKIMSLQYLQQYNVLKVLGLGTINIWARGSRADIVCIERIDWKLLRIKRKMFSFIVVCAFTNLYKNILKT